MKKRSPFSITRAVVFALVLREMQTRFGARRMGAFWLLFEPIAHIAFLMFLVTVIRGRHLPGFDYPIYLLTGLVPFFMMRNISLKMMEAINANRPLFAYPNIKPFDTFLARLIVESSLSACIYLMLLCAMGFWLGYDISIRAPLSWFASLLTGIALSFGLGLILCIVGEAMPNSKTFIKLLFLPLYLISGVIFPIWNLPARYMEWLLWNPYLHIIDNLRYSVFDHYPRIQGISFIYPVEVTFVLLFSGIALYHLRRRALVAI